MVRPGAMQTKRDQFLTDQVFPVISFNPLSANVGYTSHEGDVG